MSLPRPEPLAPELLYRVCDPAALPFATTAELPDSQEPLGQDRAVEAIRFAIGMRHRGFNLFALGPEGTGRRSLVMQYLTQAAARQPVPDDWVYVNDFGEGHRPRALRLPAGRAIRFKKDMEWLTQELAAALPAGFEAEEYRAKRQVLEQGFKERQEQAFGAVGEELMFRGYAFQLLAGAFGPWPVTCVFAVLFALAHMGNLGSWWLGTVNTGLWGLLLGISMWRSGALWLPIGLHFGWNFVLPLAGARLSGFTLGLTGYELKWNAPIWLSGGEYGPEGSLLTTLACALLTLWLWRSGVVRQPSLLLDPRPAEESEEDTPIPGENALR